ncbi:putative ankyrin repeat protein [Lasiodiplodia hormozganensis]|uniref:Ankyrin repeat protein n=1 Tax=Lasiodiplodia hormozganensis TaxID=869390 RepID=A0AA39WHG6_9PEZI|nr:putative ankyrin repeat protein [Lasiodiplodia hormozganensis]
MEKYSPHDLWEEARKQLRKDLGEGEWKTFTMQSAQGGAITISETMESLKAARDDANTKYATHKVKTSSGKELFEYNIGRILTRLDMMFQMVDSTMSYAPEMASVVWTAFRMLFNCFLIHKEACEFLSGAVDHISYAIFICEVCAKRYLGKLKDLQSYVSTATAKLDELEKCVDIGFKETVEDFIESMGKDVKVVADLMPGVSQGIQRIEESSQRIEESNKRIEESVKALTASQGKSREENDREELVKDHENLLRWLKPAAWLLDSSQLTTQHKNNLRSMSPGSCDWIFDQEDYKAWLGKLNRRIMWLFGEAGFGKSFISSAVIDAITSVDQQQSPSAAAFNRIMQNLHLGMDNLYKKKMQSLDSQYRDWLLIALRWLVCGEGLISAEPIADEIQGTYFLDNLKQEDDHCESISGDNADQERNEDGQQDSAEETDGSFYPVVINALSQHAREFLKLDSRDIIATAHGSVRDWIIRDAQQVEPLLGDKTYLCPSCKDRQCRESTFEAAPKWGHLIMARNIMRTLNNREFQKRYGLLDEENRESQLQDQSATSNDEPAMQATESTHGEEIAIVVVDVSKVTEDINDQYGSSKVVRAEPTETPAEATVKDGSCQQIKPEARAGREVDFTDEGKDNNLEEGQSTETHDFANFNDMTAEKSSSELLATQKQQVTNAWLSPGNTAEAATASNEEGPTRNDATDTGTDEGGEYQYDSIEEPTNHLRYEITHWHYHVREAESAWPDEERKAHPYAAELFNELYEQLDVFMQEGDLPFVQWQKQLRPEIFAEYGQDADKELLVEGPVHIAARYDLVGMLRRYLAAGTADLHRQNFFGNTPLHIVSYGATGFYVGSHAVLSLLLEAPDPPINLQNSRYGHTPLVLAMNGNAPESYVEALLEAGARPELPDKDGYTALHWAAERRSLPLCQLLLEGREDVVDVNARDNKGETPLHWLLWWYNSPYEVAEYLLDKGADVRAENTDSQQPLYRACKTSNTAIARLLVAWGADVDDPETIFGWTSLHAAMAEQNLDLVKLLIDEGGAEILVRDQKLRTPIAQAAELGNDAILDFLLKSQKKRTMSNSKPEQVSLGKNHVYQGEDVKRTKAGGDGNGSDDKDFLLDSDINSQTPLHRAAAKGLEGCEGRQNIIGLLSQRTPSRWGGIDRISCLDVSEDGLEVSGAAATPASKEDVEGSWQLQSVRADCPIAAGRDHYYYEITVVECKDI